MVLVILDRLHAPSRIRPHAVTLPQTPSMRGGGMRACRSWGGRETRRRGARRARRRHRRRRHEGGRMSAGTCTKCGKLGLSDAAARCEGRAADVLLCSGAWHAEHGKRNRAGNVAHQGHAGFFAEAGGNSRIIEQLRLVASGTALPGYEVRSRQDGRGRRHLVGTAGRRAQANASRQAPAGTPRARATVTRNCSRSSLSFSRRRSQSRHLRRRPGS